MKCPPPPVMQKHPRARGNARNDPVPRAKTYLYPRSDAGRRGVSGAGTVGGYLLRVCCVGGGGGGSTIVVLFGGVARKWNNHYSARYIIITLPCRDRGPVFPAIHVVCVRHVRTLRPGDFYRLRFIWWRMSDYLSFAGRVPSPLRYCRYLPIRGLSRFSAVGRRYSLFEIPRMKSAARVYYITAVALKKKSRSCVSPYSAKCVIIYISRGNYAEYIILLFTCICVYHSLRRQHLGNNLFMRNIKEHTFPDSLTHWYVIAQKRIGQGIQV